MLRARDEISRAQLPQHPQPTAFLVSFVPFWPGPPSVRPSAVCVPPPHNKQNKKSPQPTTAAAAANNNNNSATTPTASHPNTTNPRQPANQRPVTAHTNTDTVRAVVISGGRLVSPTVGTSNAYTLGGNFRASVTHVRITAPAALPSNGGGGSGAPNNNGSPTSATVFYAQNGVNPLAVQTNFLQAECERARAELLSDPTLVADALAAQAAAVASRAEHQPPFGRSRSAALSNGAHQRTAGDSNNNSNQKDGGALQQQQHHGSMDDIKFIDSDDSCNDHHNHHHHHHQPQPHQLNVHQLQQQQHQHTSRQRPMPANGCSPCRGGTVATAKEFYNELSRKGMSASLKQLTLSSPASGGFTNGHLANGTAAQTNGGLHRLPATPLPPVPAPAPPPPPGTGRQLPATPVARAAAVDASPAVVALSSCASGDENGSPSNGGVSVHLVCSL